MVFILVHVRYPMRPRAPSSSPSTDSKTYMALPHFLNSFSTLVLLKSFPSDSGTQNLSSVNSPGSASSCLSPLTETWSSSRSLKSSQVPALFSSTPCGTGTRVGANTLFIASPMLQDHAPPFLVNKIKALNLTPWNHACTTSWGCIRCLYLPNSNI